MSAIDLEKLEAQVLAHRPWIKIDHGTDNTVKVTTTCNQCGHEDVFFAFRQDWHRWITTAKIQEAFPYLNADQREGIISGTCGTCWINLFGTEDDE